MKSLLATTAVLEFGTGLVLIALPSALTMLLLGSQLDTPVGLTIARIGGVALLTIGTACWLARLVVHAAMAGWCIANLLRVRH